MAFSASIGVTIIFYGGQSFFALSPNIQFLLISGKRQPID